MAGVGFEPAWASQGFRLSGGLPGLLAVTPGGVLVAEGAGLEAAAEDAGEPAGQAPEGVVVAVALGALLVAEGAGAR